MLMISTHRAEATNQCVQCPSPQANEFVCAVNDEGVTTKFGSECLLRFSNCEKKTSESAFVARYVTSRKTFLTLLLFLSLSARIPSDRQDAVRISRSELHQD
jgi:hypothetical protein